MKKIIVGLVVVVVLMIAVFIWQSNNHEDDNYIETEDPVGDGFSVHGLNWEDVEGMNERVSDMTLNIPPYFMGRMVETHLDLAEVFRLFGENQHLLRDQPEVPGLTLESDFEVVLTFSNLTGNEIFLNGNGSESVFSISFYVDSSLAQTSLDLAGDAVYAYFREQNPEVVLTLAEVDWDALRDDYEAHLYGVTIDESQGRPAYLPLDILDPTDVLRFFEENRYNVSQDWDDTYNYMASINFRRESEDSPDIRCIFFMTESMHRELISLIDDEVWEKAKELDLEDSNQKFITLAEVDWDVLREDYGEYVSIISLSGPPSGAYDFDDVVGFQSEEENILSVILNFLEENQDDVVYTESREHRYLGIIYFTQENESNPRVISKFFMNETMSRRLRDLIGEEEWQRSRR